jgi:hypothetical protein
MLRRATTMTKQEIRKTERYKEARTNIKRHGGFNLVGKYKMTDGEIEKYLIDMIAWCEIELQAAKDMLKEKDFH